MLATPSSLDKLLGRFKKTWKALETFLQQSRSIDVYDRAGSSLTETNTNSTSGLGRVFPPKLFFLSSQNRKPLCFMYPAEHPWAFILVWSRLNAKKHSGPVSSRRYGGVVNPSLHCHRCPPTELFIAQWYQKKGASIVYEMAVKQIFDSFFFPSESYKQGSKGRRKEKKKGNHFRSVTQSKRKGGERNGRGELKEKRRKVKRRREKPQLSNLNLDYKWTLMWRKFFVFFFFLNDKCLHLV